MNDDQMRSLRAEANEADSIAGALGIDNYTMPIRPRTLLWLLDEIDNLKRLVTILEIEP